MQHTSSMLSISRHTSFIVLALALLCSEARAQAAPLIGTCSPAIGEGELNVGNVRARIPNNGALFYRSFPHLYEVPKGSGSNAIFAGSIWIGGLVGGAIRMIAARYGAWEFWAGPLDEAGRPPDDCSAYDRVWEIRRDDIRAFIEQGAVSENLQAWPWHLGAPVLDGDGDPTNYDLEGGDLPLLRGDQTLWWVMNDRGNVHETTNSEPIGLEVHGMAFAYEHPGFIGNQTFYQYTLINKNTQPLESAYFGLYMDADLGNFADDYRGSDSLLHMVFTYNADNLDEGGEGYGVAPPAVGFAFLQTAQSDKDGKDNDRDGEVDEAGEMIGMSNALFFGDGGGVNETPLTAQDHYYYMQARWKDGRRLIEGGNGFDLYHLPEDAEIIPTNFSLSGDPVAGSYWSELNVDGLGTVSVPGWRFVFGSSGPFRIDPGESLDIRFAVVWARGADHLDSVTELKKQTRTIRAISDTYYEPARFNATLPRVIPAREVLGFDQNFPNPFSSSTTLRYSLPKPMNVRLAVYDVLGREVALLVDTAQDTGVYEVNFNAGTLPAGVYLAQIELDYLRFTKRMTLID